MVAIDENGIAMYKTDDGKLIGHMKLPEPFSSSKTPANAIRFCGAKKDMLVASSEWMVRISSTNGKVVGRCEGIGEPIADWFVNTHDDTTLIRSESGKLFGGDSMLKSVKPYNLGSRVTVSSAALNDQGDRIAASVDRKPRVYVQKDFQIIEQIDSEEINLDANIDVCFDGKDEIWSDGDGIFARIRSRGDEVTTKLFHMFWKPHHVSKVQVSDGFAATLIVGTRFFEEKEQPVLFSFNIFSRKHTVPIVLEKLPTRIAHSRTGKEVILFNDGEAELLHRLDWQQRDSQCVRAWAYRQMANGKFAVIEKVLEVVNQQTRLGYGVKPEVIQWSILDGIADRVAELVKKNSGSDELKQFNALVKVGNETAVAAEGLFHYDEGWRARGNGMGNSVSQSGWQTYREELEKSAQSLNRLMEISDRPPLVAFSTLIRARIETDGNLDNVDVLSRRASQLYPGELAPHFEIMGKLLPQWYGEVGDAASFAVSASKIYEQPYSDLLYMRMVARSAYWLDSRNQSSYKTIDAERIRRGVDECIRQNAAIDHDMWELWLDLFVRQHEKELMNRIFRHLIENTAAAPSDVARSLGINIDSHIHQFAELIRTGRIKVAR